jgi:hypothetical protein
VHRFNKLQWVYKAAPQMAQLNMVAYIQAENYQTCGWQPLVKQ